MCVLLQTKLKRFMRKFAKSNQLLKKVSRAIPLATQTFSKSYLQYAKGCAPLFVTHAKGSYIWDVDGNKYLDLINGLLPVILGYQYKAVDDAIRAQLKRGITFSLPCMLEYELAELLIEHIPCAEMVRFGKNGSDATTGAIRVARAVTGRDRVAVCGYHGWHDWFIGSTPRNLGVPASTSAMTHKFVYNDLDSLKKLFVEHPEQFAAVIMEPMNLDEPNPGFLEGVRDLAHEHGALLIFDEIITGFRFHLGGAQKLFGVTPDLATFGKSMANGMPISALVGKRQYMEKVNDIFYSFTNGGEALSLAAAIATIHEIEKKKVIPAIWKLGKTLQDGVRGLIRRHRLEGVLQLKGKPCWQLFVATPQEDATDFEIKTWIQQEMLQSGYLWIGSHNMSFSHTARDIAELLKTYDRLFAELRTLLDAKTLRAHLRGAPISNLFKVR